jgi:hypothetical protein
MTDCTLVRNRQSVFWGPADVPRDDGGAVRDPHGQATGPWRCSAARDDGRRARNAPSVAAHTRSRHRHAHHTARHPRSHPGQAVGVRSSPPPHFSLRRPRPHVATHASPSSSMQHALAPPPPHPTPRHPSAILSVRGLAASCGEGRRTKVWGTADAGVKPGPPCKGHIHTERSWHHAHITTSRWGPQRG